MSQIVYILKFSRSIKIALDLTQGYAFLILNS